MDPLNFLREGLANHDFPSRGSGAEQILKRLDDVLEENGETCARTPPFHVFAYAIKSIVYPTFRIDLIPEFLELLTMIEFYRLRVTDKASIALTWNEYYKDNETQDIHTLKEEDEEYFQYLQDTQVDQRKVFMQIISEYCTIDLHRLWIAESNTKFWIRWNEYFTVSNKTGKAKKTSAFHHDISDSDLQILRQSAERCNEIMHHTILWAEEERDRGQPIEDVFKTRAFLERFAVLEVDASLLNLVSYYLAYVQDAVERFQAISTSFASQHQ
ncbi:hypothetical protein B0H34DRAFT_795709 [Crassisporium funariophilum]|nr:hypothetical protein B0H34DRAFT_795709 [Crassisporium funariophilum]